MPHPSPAILGLATQRPAHWIDQSDAAAVAVGRCCVTAQQAKLLPALYRRTRVERRGSVLLSGSNGHNAEPNAIAFYPAAEDAEDRGPRTSTRMARYAADAVPLAIGATMRALQLASVEPEAIDQLVVVSCTGFMSPGIDVRLIKALGLRATTGRTIVGFMGCHGAVNGLRVARGLATEGGGRTVLLCAVELCSLHFQYGWDPQMIVANALFADGAAAMVLGPSARSGEDANGDAWRLAATGSCLIPDSEEEMTWVIGDHGFEMTLSPRVPELIEAHVRPWLASWLGGQGLAVEDIGSWAVHPGGPRIVGAVEAALGLTAEATATSRAVLAECGNMSSPTLLFILERLRQTEARRPCVAVGFGPGLMAEAALLR